MMLPKPPPFAELWSLDPSVAYLNHGAFGACPTAALDRQTEWRARLERQPTAFMRDLEGLLDSARAALADFVGSDADDLVFVPNATSGVNTVLRSLDLEAGDEILTTNHAYNSCKNALCWQEERGVNAVIVTVPWPLESPDDVVDAVLAGVTPRTKLVMLDHVTSPTALIFPVETLVARLAERGIDTLVDGAHAPGMLPLDLRALGAAYYTGNCHKWICSPKGAAFLHVRRDRQTTVKPLAQGHGRNSARTDRCSFRLQNDWIATTDPTAYLTVPFCIDFLGKVLPGGFAALREHNRRLACDGQKLLCDALGVEPPAPASMIGSIAAIPLPDYAEAPPDWSAGAWVHPLQLRLLEEAHIEVPVFVFPKMPKQHIRISAQIYNSLDQVRALADALVPMLSRAAR